MPPIDAPEDTLRGFLHLFSMVTGPTAVALLAVAVGLARRGRWLLLPGTVLVANLASHVLKRVVGRERPPEGEWLVEVSSASFPSGHATGAAAGAAALTFLLGWRVLVGLVWLGAGGVGISRVLLGVHWPTDVLAGWLLGVVAAVVVWSATQKLIRRKQPPPGVL